MEPFLDKNNVYIESKAVRLKECKKLLENSGRPKSQPTKAAKSINEILTKLNFQHDVQSVDDIGQIVGLLIQLNETFDPNLGLTEAYIAQIKLHVDSLVSRLCALFDQVLQYSCKIQILPGKSHHYIQSCLNLVVQFLSDLFDSRFRLQSQISEETLHKMISTFLPCYHYAIVQNRCLFVPSTSLSFHSIYMFLNHYFLSPVSTQRPALFDQTIVACILLRILREFKNLDYEPVPSKSNLSGDPFLICANELVERFLNNFLTCRQSVLNRNIDLDTLFFEFYLTFEAFDYESQLPNSMKLFLVEIFKRHGVKAWNHFVLIDRECKNDQSVQLIKFLKECGFQRSYSKPEGEERSVSKSVIERTTRRTNRTIVNNNNGIIATINGKRKRSD